MGAARNLVSIPVLSQFEIPPVVAVDTGSGCGLCQARQVGGCPVDDRRVRLVVIILAVAAVIALIAVYAKYHPALGTATTPPAATGTIQWTIAPSSSPWFFWSWWG